MSEASEQVVKKKADMKKRASITQENIEGLKLDVNRLLEANPPDPANVLQNTVSKALAVQLALVEMMQQVRDECRENVEMLKANMESVVGSLDVGAEGRRNLGEAGEKLKERDMEIRERVDIMNSKLEDLYKDVEGNLAKQMEEFELFKEKMERKVLEVRYKCRNIMCLQELGRYLSPREDGVSVQCTRPSCRMLNIVAEVKEGEKWMQCQCGGHLNPHFQRYPVEQEEGEVVTCRICKHEMKIMNAHYYMAKYNVTD